MPPHSMTVLQLLTSSLQTAACSVEPWTLESHTTLLVLPASHLATGNENHYATPSLDTETQLHWRNLTGIYNLKVGV